jgi:polygalacturonase
VQLMRSSNIIISNITLQNSPFWTLHTYDCKNVTISETTILAPTTGAPNTDGIDPGHLPIYVSYFLSCKIFIRFGCNIVF